MRVGRASLGPLKELAEGGFGKVYHAERYHLPGDSSAIAFKEFTTQIPEQARAAENAVSFRDSLRLTGTTSTAARCGRGLSSRSGVPSSVC